MQGCVPLDVLCTCQAHRPHTAISRDNSSLLSAAGKCPLAHWLTLHQFIQHKPCALLQAHFLGVTAQWSSQTSMKNWILSKLSVQGLTLAYKFDPHNKADIWCCLFGCPSSCFSLASKAVWWLPIEKKHSWLLKGILKIIPRLGETRKYFLISLGFYAYSEGKRLTQRLM